MPINLKGGATNAAHELAVAFSEGSTEAIEQAFTVFQNEVAEQLADEFTSAQGDRTILSRSAASVSSPLPRWLTSPPSAMLLQAPILSRRSPSSIPLRPTACLPR